MGVAIGCLHHSRTLDGLLSALAHPLPVSDHELPGHQPSEA